MTEEIEAAKKRAKRILQQRQGSLDQPQDFVLVPFNDPVVGPLTATNDADRFIQAIDSLTANGGGDDPELALKGILLAIENCRVGSTVFVITDVDAKDVELQDLVVAQAKQKSIKVTFLLTNTIVNNVCKTQPSKDSSDLLKRRCLTASFKHGLELYKYIADSTSGKTLVVKEGDILKATEIVDTSVKQGIAVISRKYITGGRTSYPLNIDSSITEIFVEFEGDCRDITISFQRRIFLIEDLVTIGTFMEGRIPVKQNFGVWNVKVTGWLGCSIKIEARTTKGFIQTLGRKSLNNAGLNVTEKFEGQPLITDNIVVLLDTYRKESGDKVGSVKFISKARSAVLDTFRMANNGSNHFKIEPLNRHNQAFLVSIEGVDSNGFPFTRIMRTAIEYVHVQIECVAIHNVTFRPGDTANVSVRIQNFGTRQQSFQLDATDNQQFVDGVKPGRVTLAARPGVATVTVSLTASKTATVGTSTTITITAKSSSSDTLLYKTCYLTVGQRARPRVEEFYVTTKINSRIAETLFTSVVHNDAAVAREAEFFVLLPSEAFVTDFRIKIGNETYRGRIEEKGKAAKVYELAKQRQLTAGHVTSRDRSTSIFRTSVNLEPGMRGTFELTYQELLRRKSGKYTYEVAVRMLQPVAKFSLFVSVCETNNVENVKVLGYDTEQTTLIGPQPIEGAIVFNRGRTANVIYQPTLSQQATISPFGIHGKFAIQYELSRVVGKGDFMISGSYFVNFLAPAGAPMPKRVVFALDVSASMYGQKMSQVRSAMSTILDSLAPDDEFAITTFNGTVDKWTPVGYNLSLVPASAENKRAAKAFLNGVEPQGGTNLLKVIFESVKQLRDAAEAGSEDSPLGGASQVLPTTDFVVLLTDGQPTIGITDWETIQFSVHRYNNKTFAIHTIGLGTLVDMTSLRKIASQNRGTSTQVFADIDAHVQIASFFDAISRPVMDQVMVDYPQKRVASVNNAEYPSFHAGDELVITGQLQSRPTALNDPARVFRRRKRATQFPVTITGLTRTGQVTLTEEVTPRAFGSCQTDNVKIQSFSERLQVFMKLKSLLREIAAAENKTKEEILRSSALKHSLRYGFVTPGITSMIVVKPGDLRQIEKVITAEEANRARTTEVEPEALSAAPGDTRVFKFAKLPGIDPSLFGKPANNVRMEVIGDPHVVIDINQNTRVCFNWLGQDNKYYNILRNNESGVNVNAKLIGVPGNFIYQRPCFVGEIGIVLRKLNISIKIEPLLVSVKLPAGNLNLSTEVSTRQTFSGISINIVNLSEISSRISVSLEDNLEFMVKAHFDFTDLAKTKHLDLSVAKTFGFTGSTDGLLGQFVSPNATKSAEVITTFNSEVATLRFRQQSVKVKEFGVYDTYAKRRVKCWLLNNFLNLLNEKQEDYEIPDIFTSSAR
uniref:Inter-alpha-trypsin inhibitor heavy chain H3 n=1 Tax=Phallusia mammillata TaxID=59560 RepID=A0A6F9DGA2_9ASCI|nr:inter-alpha-trypsin inhibitor heavy chain H3 [Phallusia mammillata]